MKSFEKRTLLMHIVSITLMTCLVSLGMVKQALSQHMSDSVAIQQSSNLRASELVTTEDLQVLSLLQGRVAGLSAYKRGSDPNGPFSYRIKGFITNERTEPLYVVNGIPMLSHESIHPMDIQSVQVLTSVAEILPYGLRAAHGVIEIETNQPRKITENNTILAVDATSFVASSSVSKAWNVFGRNEFLNAGGNDLGEETDWQEVVSRSALSTVHQIRISGKSTRSSFLVSGNIQEREGVLKESGNVQRTFRADVYQLLLEDKLRISAQTSIVSRDIDFSFTEAFRYATVQNPTSPIRFDNGNFYQPIQFDNYNPLSIIELNEHEGKTSQTLMSGSISYQMLQSLHINAYLAYEQRQFSRSEFYSPYSFFRGLTNNGMIRYSDASHALSSMETTATFRQQWKDVRLDWETGFSIWNKSIQKKFTQIRNIPTVDSYQNLELEPIFSSGNEALFELKQSQSPELINVSLFSTAQLNTSSFDLSGTLRREEFNYLGIGGQTELYGSMSLATPIHELLALENLNSWTATLSYGSTGMLPNAYGQSQTVYERFGANLFPTIEPNPSLELPRLKEWNLGTELRLLNNKLSVQINGYIRNSEKLILSAFIPASESQTGAFRQFQNSFGIENTGISGSISYHHSINASAEWRSQFTLNSSKSTVQNAPFDRMMMGYLGAPGQGSQQILKLENGKEFGLFWGPVFEQVGEHGDAIMADLNGDGQLLTNPGDALNPDSDYSVLGKATPDFEFGWNNAFHWKNWHFNTLLIGAFGHSLANMNRLFYEPIDPGAINVYNRHTSDKSVKDLTVSRYSSLYVERADFLRLQNMQVMYAVNMEKIRQIRALKLFLTVENVFTITKYSGVNPEPIYYDYGPTSNGAYQADQPDALLAGIDRRTQYLPARTFIFGVTLAL